ncbi:hypothetical protein [Streptomyces sp. NPDC058294]|uniref:hypothetical protein n=1 Tax=Streptomyces sp. NPDC058294 TaxID=3346430 RepID=UPI0036EFBEDC
MDQRPGSDGTGCFSPSARAVRALRTGSAVLVLGVVAPTARRRGRRGTRPVAVRRRAPDRGAVVGGPPSTDVWATGIMRAVTVVTPATWPDVVSSCIPDRARTAEVVHAYRP